MLRWCLLWARTYVTPGPQPTRWLLFSIYLLIYLKGHQHQPAIRRRLVKSWNAMNNPRGQSVITSDWFNPQTWLGFRCGTFLRHVAGRLILDEPSVIYCLINPYSRLISHEDEDGGGGLEDFITCWWLPKGSLNWPLNNSPILLRFLQFMDIDGS